MTDLIISVAKSRPIADAEIEAVLAEICEDVHSSCDSSCPVYLINGNKVPDTANNFRINRGCDCFKSGSKMLAYIRNH